MSKFGYKFGYKWGPQRGVVSAPVITSFSFDTDAMKFDTDLTTWDRVP